MKIGADSSYVVTNPNPDPILDLLNPKSIGLDKLSRTTAVQSFKSFRSGLFVLSC